MYLVILYKAILAMAYYGLFRIGELTMSPHVIRVKEVHLATNKRKMLFVLRSSKTHSKANLPQTIKIISNPVKTQRKTANFCPYHLLTEYLSIRSKSRSVAE